MVDLQAVYDRYAGGLPDPSAVRDFLTEAWQTWSLKPRFAVLVGSGNWDYRHSQGLGENPVPPLMASTPNGLFASDNALGDVEEGDGVPEIAVGATDSRISEMEDFITKVAAYEAAASGRGTTSPPWPLHADDAGVFAETSDAIEPHLGGFQVDRIELDTTDLADARNELIQTMQSGAWLVNYVGHGGTDRMAAEGLLTTGDLPGMTSTGRLPIVSSLTCVVGRFEIPGFTSLGEALVLGEDRGAIAVWAPSGLSLNPAAKVLNECFIQTLRRNATIGEAVLTP